MILIVLKFVFSVVGGQDDYWPWAPKSIAAPLVSKSRLHVQDVASWTWLCFTPPSLDWDIAFEQAMTALFHVLQLIFYYYCCYYYYYYYYLLAIRKNTIYKLM